LREEAITRRPVSKLTAGGGEQAGHGVASETKQRTQREDLRTEGDAELVEGGEALGPELLEVGEEPGGVFLKKAAAPGGGGPGGSYPR